MIDRTEEEYMKAAELSAPDMDALWNRIASAEPTDDDITPFVQAAQQLSAPAPRRSAIIRTFSSIAAVFAAIFCIKMVSANMSTSQMESAASDNNISFEQNDDAAYEEFIRADSDLGYAEEAAPREESALMMIYPENEWDFSDAQPSAYEYGELDLSWTIDSAVVKELEGRSSNELFTEEGVLRATDLFLDCRILSSEVNGDSVYYSVFAIHLIGGDEPVAEQLTIVSHSPYALRTGREYLLPISVSGDEYTVVFDTAPQIEITEDRSVICHNGWSSLGGSSLSDYPQTYADDYFYDRMNITAESALGNLFEEWRRIGG